MAEFKAAYQKTMSHEGLYSNDPRDLGGETWRGIARKKQPDWEGWQVVDAIKCNVAARDLAFRLNGDEELEEMVQAFYQAEFWNKLMLDKITSQEVANELFDTAVNQGRIIAVKQFQQSLNLLNNNQKHYSDINEDGKMGDKTLRAHDAYMLTANFAGRSQERVVSTIIKVMNGLQFGRYVEICENNPAQEVYFYGWINRIQ